MEIANLILSVIVIISDSNTNYMGRFANNIKDDDVMVVSVTPSITVHLVAVSIILCFISGDSLSYHNNQQFTTKDRDNDEWTFGILDYNCAVNYHGAWWYKSCYYSNLNGKYFKGGKINTDGIFWYHWKNNHYSLKRVNMKIRPNLV